MGVAAADIGVIIRTNFHPDIALSMIESLHLEGYWYLIRKMGMTAEVHLFQPLPAKQQGSCVILIHCTVHYCRSQGAPSG